MFGPLRALISWFRRIIRWKRPTRPTPSKKGPRRGLGFDALEGRETPSVTSSFVFFGPGAEPGKLIIAVTAADNVTISTSHGLLTVNGKTIVSEPHDTGANVPNGQGGFKPVMASTLARSADVKEIDLIAKGNFKNRIDLSHVDAAHFTRLAYLNVNAGLGDDTVVMSPLAVKNSVINGGGGQDTLDYSKFKTRVVVNLAIGKATDARLVLNFENIIGGSGNDLLTGSGTRNTIDGGAGNDIIHGGGGNDHLYGGLGNDHLYGEAGADVIDGGPGNDTIFGGLGNDFLFGGTGRNRVVQ